MKFGLFGAGRSANAYHLGIEKPSVAPCALTPVDAERIKGLTPIKVAMVQTRALEGSPTSFAH